MRLLTFVPRPGEPPRLGVVLSGGGILDLGEEARRRGATLPFDAGDMISLIAAGGAGLASVRDLAASPRSAALAQESVRLRAPVHPRKNVFCVGWNYLEHFKEGEAWRQAKVELPEHPVFFSKAVSAVSGPLDPIPYDPKVSREVDWEAELGVVIGAPGKNVSEGDAMRHVFGYLVVNDVSAREIQKQHGGQWHKGKSLDGYCPMGPWITTADEVDPSDLRIGCRVNGVVKQDSRTRHLYFKIPRLIAELSLGLTLEPGDVISTGTPSGVGFGRNPPEFMKPGDVLETEIEGLGLLRNRVEPTV